MADPKMFSDVLREELTHFPRNPVPLSDLKQSPTEPKTEAERRALEAVRRAALYEQLHTCQNKISALCLSGGGIRSASFSLGVLQGLAKAGVLKSFNYLSTVSGGGFVGGWLTAWIKDHSERPDALTTPSPLTTLESITTRNPVDPEVSQIRFLRAYSNYLAPRLGILSADTWTLIATFLRNMLLNWLVIIPLLITVLMVPRAFMGGIMSRMPDWLAQIAWLLGGICIAISTSYGVEDLPSAGNKCGREKRFLLRRLLPLIFGAWILVLGWAWRYNLSLPTPTPEAVNQVGNFSVADPLLWWQPLLFFVVATLVGTGFGLFRARNRNSRKVVRATDLVWGAFSQILSALLGALAIWWVAVHWFATPTARDSVINYAAFAPPLLLGVFLLGNFLFSGLAGRVTEDEDREWWGRASGWVLLSIVTLTILGVIVFWCPIWIAWLEQSNISPKTIFTTIGGLGGISGVLSALLGYSSKNGVDQGGNNRLRALIPTIGAILFLVSLAVLLIVIFDHLIGPAYELPFTTPNGFWNPEALWLVGCFFIPLIIGLLMSFLINVNDFSLHAMYRNRLIRAYFGAARKERNAHPFTGFDPKDNFELKTLVKEARAQQPLHIINTSLNLVASQNLAWQERKAEPFSISCLHCGCADPAIGYQPADTYAEGISIGTAITISGAAANPNMGYHSSPLVTLLMTLFNVRLGWWLPNPGKPGHEVWSWRGPRFSAGPLLTEAFGMTTNEYSYVNLSDGGHFENLGIYEMVLRRCHFIVAIDGGQDEKYVFEDLGNAIRKIRIDMGITLDIQLKYVNPQRDNKQLAHCAYGVIKYGDVDTVPDPADPSGKRRIEAPSGHFVYIKPVLTGEEPADVGNYHAAHPAFPHETTSDQFFSESQLESYRMLGCHSMTQIAGKVSGSETCSTFGSLKAFMDRVKVYTEGAAAAPDNDEPPPVFERWMRAVIESENGHNGH
ncbi:MAG: conserved rane protein of unknown function [Chthoniobacteraceae bacterium]|nr:conserved rane protein of unknown function [Chthoniobacteraceae bacterium]